MEAKQNKSILLLALLFISSALLMYFDIFHIPDNAGSEYMMDKLFYNSINITFWLTAPFFINLLIRKVIWQSEFKSSIDSKLLGRFDVFITTFIYFASIGILLVKIFKADVTISLLLLYFLFYLIIVFTKPRLYNMFQNSLTGTTKSYKVGDWINLINKSGSYSVTGKVTSLEGTAIQLKSINNTLLSFPKHLINEFIIENYRGFSKEVQFDLTFEISNRIEIERGKRILAAAAMHALIELNNNEKRIPEVLLHKIHKETIEYKVNYWITPWEPLNPEQVKDAILLNIINHLKIANIDFNHDNISNICGSINLFDSLSKEEIEKLYTSSKKILFKNGIEIIKQGDQGSSMFVLEEGLLNVIIQSNEKRQIAVARIAPGQFFGEMSLLTGESRSATVIALTDSIVAEITKEAIQEIINKNPNIIDRFAEIITERQRNNYQKLEDFNNQKKTLMQKLILGIKSFFDIK